MHKSSRSMLPLLLVALPQLASSQQLADVCKTFLAKPVFTTTTVNATAASKENFRLFQCSANFKSSSEAQAAGIDVTVPIYDIPVPINANWSDAKVEQWKSSHCSDQERKAQAQLAYYSSVYSVDPISAKTALECARILGGVTTAQFDTAALRCTLNETQAAYVFEARWRRTSGEQGSPPKVVSFTTMNTTCMNATALAPNANVSEGGVPVLCSVTDKAAAFTLVTDRGGCSAAGTVRLPKIQVPSMVLSGPEFISGQEVEIMANAKIVTNGYPFTIRADRLTLAGPVRVISFDPYTPNQMQPGRNAGGISISAGEFVGTSLSILNAGGPGGPGSQGAKGPPGGPGQPGKGRTTNWKKNCPIPLVCDIIPTGCEGGDNGGRGGQGGQGYVGNPGMPGGAAGEVTIDVPLDARKFINVMTNVDLNGQPRSDCNNQICGGVGGAGGLGGPGGDGGPGGPGAPGTVYCGGTDAGGSGPPGATGPSGGQGPNGLNALVRG